MPTDVATTLVILLSFVVTFTVARLLSRGWRRKRAQKEEAQRRINESRQVRRARERRTPK